MVSQELLEFHLRLAGELLEDDWDFIHLSRQSFAYRCW
jgi:hypothetical protein